MENDSTATRQRESGSASVGARLRRLLRRSNPAKLGLLGLLSVPGYVFDPLAPLRIFAIFYLFFLWMFVGPLVDIVLDRRTETEAEPTDWIRIGSLRYHLTGLLTLPTILLNPLVVTQDFLQAVGGIVAFVRHRGSLPDAASYDQDVSYRLPVEGSWTVVNGSPEREHSHSWIYPSQRYAYDLLVTDEEGRSRPEGSSTAVEEHYCYDEPVLAPADGVVVDAFDTEFESSRAGGLSHPLKRSLPGGHVVIKHTDAEYSCLAHLRPRSVAVEPGDRVRRGQQVGRCGHSGVSSEPHLHFQIQDRPDLLMSASLPVQFDDVRLESPGPSHEPDLVPGHDVWHSGGAESDPSVADSRIGSESVHDPDGYHDRTFIIRGQRVTHAGEGGDAGAGDTDDAGLPDSPEPRSERADAEPVTAARSTRRRATAVLQRAAYGLAVGGLITFLTRPVVSGSTIALVLGVAAAAGVAFRYGFGLFSDGRYQGRMGSFGASLGLALAAAAVTAATSGAVGTGVVGGLSVLGGFFTYVALTEYDTAGLTTGPDTRRTSPAS